MFSEFISSVSPRSARDEREREIDWNAFHVSTHRRKLMGGGWPNKIVLKGLETYAAHKIAYENPGYGADVNWATSY